jgi:hypothetical protein
MPQVVVFNKTLHGIGEPNTRRQQRLRTRHPHDQVEAEGVRGGANLLRRALAGFT